MKKTVCLVLIFALLFGAFTSCSTKNIINKSESKSNTTTNTSEEYTLDYTLSPEISNADSKKLSKIFDNKLNKLGFEGLAYVVENDNVIYNKGYGYADKKTKRKLSENTVFRIASLTKQFTAAAVLLLQEKGKLSVNDKLSKYFPKCSYANKITLDNLLKMRSGIPDYLNYKVYLDFFDKDNKFKNTAEKNRKYLLNKLFKQQLRFTPGEKNEYSNSNYFLLAEIIEMVSKTTYHNFLKKNIFKKLKMENTDFSDNISKFKEKTAKPYNYKTEELEFFKIKGGDFGCADMISTASDLRKWADSLRNNSVISYESLKAMTDAESGYGYGVKVLGNRAAVIHSGSLPPYESTLFISLKKPYYTCIVLNNSSFKIAGDILIRLSKEYLKNRIQ